jgi:hypothetical protein
MYMVCRHIKANGLRCESPALKGSQFCYYHSKVHIIGAQSKLKDVSLQLPAPEDPAAIQLSVARISNALLSGRIDTRKAASLLYGLQVVAHFIDSKKFFYPPETVQSAEQTSEGDDLASYKYVCSKKDDCNKCPYTETCTTWVYADDETTEKEDEEDEEDESEEADSDEDEEDDDDDGDDEDGNEEN